MDLYISIGILVILVVLCFIVIYLIKLIKDKNKDQNITLMREQIRELKLKIDSFDNLKSDIQLNIKNEFNVNLDRINSYFNLEREAINKIYSNVTDQFINFNKTINDQFKVLYDVNNKKLDEINKNVNEKLEKSINDRLNQSFKNILEQMTNINKGIGEIKVLANDVSSLNNVLTNVKTKGIIGEVMLENIISETLTKDQYIKNFRPFERKNDVVEYAVKIKSLDNSVIYLPIDSKFPLENYNRIIEAIDECDKIKLDKARKDLKNEIRKFAKDISEKYINVPFTTNYAIMFLPVEGLYAEIINSDVFDEIRTKFNICIASPSTLTALLNSLQLGFKTITIAKKSEEVFKTLTKVKEEFLKFETSLNESIKALDNTKNKLEDVVGVRTRQIIKQLDKIEVEDNLLESGVLDE